MERERIRSEDISRAAPPSFALTSLRSSVQSIASTDDNGGRFLNRCEKDSGDQVLHHVSVNIGEAEVAPRVAVGEFGVIEAE